MPWWLTHAAGLFLPRFLSPSPTHRRVCKVLGWAHEDVPDPYTMTCRLVKKSIKNVWDTNNIEYFRYCTKPGKRTLFIVLPLSPSRCSPHVPCSRPTTLLKHWQKTLFKILWLRTFLLVSRRQTNCVMKLLHNSGRRKCRSLKDKRLPNRDAGKCLKTQLFYYSYFIRQSETLKHCSYMQL